MTPRKIKGYGYKPDLGDPRDHLFAAPLTPLPPAVDLRSKFPPPWDQGNLGSCTAFALTGAVAFLHGGFEGSQLWLYYQERKIEGDIRADAGAEIRDGIKVLAKLGLPPEADWPYVVSKFAKSPSAKANKDAKMGLISSYERLAGPADYKACLASGMPFVVGITCYEGLESDDAAKTGHVPMPAGNPIGGHAICIVGYQADGSWIFRNSWGNWGVDQSGYGFLPQAYLASSDLATDAWVVRK